MNSYKRQILTIKKKLIKKFTLNETKHVTDEKKITNLRIKVAQI